MAIMFVRAQVISRGAGRTVVSAAAYRHRARMMDEQAGTSFSYRGGEAELKHEELALPDQIPAWLRTAIDGKTVAEASEALWNAVNAFETRADAQLARELIIALPEELTRSENIALVRDFVRDNLTTKGMIADWVYHDKDGNPHIHLMTTLRPLTEEGFGQKKVPVLGADGEPLRVVTPDRPNGKIVYKVWAGDKETMKDWRSPGRKRRTGIWRSPVMISASTDVLMPNKGSMYGAYPQRAGGNRLAIKFCEVVIDTNAVPSQF